MNENENTLASFGIHHHVDEQRRDKLSKEALASLATIAPHDAWHREVSRAEQEDDEK